MQATPRRSDFRVGEQDVATRIATMLSLVAEAGRYRANGAFDSFDALKTVSPPPADCEAAAGTLG